MDRRLKPTGPFTRPPPQVSRLGADGSVEAYLGKLGIGIATAACVEHVRPRITTRPDKTIHAKSKTEQNRPGSAAQMSTAQNRTEQRRDRAHVLSRLLQVQRRSGGPCALVAHTTRSTRTCFHACIHSAIQTCARRCKDARSPNAPVRTRSALTRPPRWSPTSRPRSRAMGWVGVWSGSAAWAQHTAAQPQH